MSFTYTTYRASIYGLEDQLMNSIHCMIAGASGSGKSVLIRRCLVACACFGYSTALIDPKGCELRPWKDCANTYGYAEHTEEIISLLRDLVRKMEERLHGMPNRQRMYEGTDIWAIIDEYADLVTCKQKHEIKTLVQRLAQKGRAARIHVLLATQRPTRDIIDGAIKVNITTRVALHCPTAQDSRNIINISGAEDLPVHGEAYYMKDSGEVLHVKVPMLSDLEEFRCIDYMEEQKRLNQKKRRGLFRRAA